MNIEEAIKRELKESTALAALVGDRIFYVKADQDMKEPYVVFFKVSAIREHTHQGAAGLANARFQFSSFAMTYLEAKQIAEQIQSILQGKNEVIGGAGGVYASIFYDNELDLTENNLFHVAQDFIVIHNE
jgi:hypothetical protein